MKLFHLYDFSFFFTFFLVIFIYFGFAGSSLLLEDFSFSERVLFSSSDAQDARCRGLSCGARPRRSGSVAVAHVLSLCACRIFPDQRLNPCPLHCQTDS